MATKIVSAEDLKKCAHLKDLTRDALEKLASIAEDRIVCHGETVLLDGDPADRLFLLVRGEIDICCELGSGVTRIMDTVAEGELFAWSALVDPYRYTSTAIAETDCELIAFDARRLREMIQSDVDLGFHVLGRIVQLLSNRLEAARVQLAACQ